MVSENWFKIRRKVNEGDYHYPFSIIISIISKVLCTLLAIWPYGLIILCCVLGKNELCFLSRRKNTAKTHV